MRHHPYRRSRIVLFVFSIALGILAACRLPADAQNATPVAGSVLPSDATVDGLTLGVWHARYVQWYVGLLVDGVTTYDDDTGARCAYGQHGPVFFLDGAAAPVTIERACTVPDDVVLFVPIFGRECSTVEPDPELPDPAHAGEAALRACAATHIDVGLERDLSVASLTVDGAGVNLAPYRALSPLFTLVWPAGNQEGVPAGVAKSVVDGYAVLVGPLSEGEHVVAFTTPSGGGSVATITYRLTVSSGASPA